MTDPATPLDPAGIRRRALSRWDNEGGAAPPSVAPGHAEIPDMTNAELVHLHIRVIALENLVIAVLAEGSDRQIAVAREMAGYISPRPGFTRHPLTVQAADHITDIVDRALHFRTVRPV